MVYCNCPLDEKPGPYQAQAVWLYHKANLEFPVFLGAVYFCL
jgi:hypothetical protein